MDYKRSRIFQIKVKFQVLTGDLLAEFNKMHEKMTAFKKEREAKVNNIKYSNLKIRLLSE